MSNLNAASPSSVSLFDDAHAYFLGAYSLVEGAIANGAGTSLDDPAGQLLLPIKLLLDNALQPFDALKNAVKQKAPADKTEDLRGKAVLILLAALAIAKHADESEDDGGDSGYLIFPIRLLLDTANDRFSILEAALVGASK